MASAMLDPPGTELGPCEEECEHIDCSTTRAMAEEVCTYCGEEIGYDRSFVRERDTVTYSVSGLRDLADNLIVLAHLVCAIPD